MSLGIRVEVQHRGELYVFTNWMHPVPSKGQVIVLTPPYREAERFLVEHVEWQIDSFTADKVTGPVIESSVDSYVVTVRIRVSHT